MRRAHQIVGGKGNAALRQFLAKEGAALVPMEKLVQALGRYGAGGGAGLWGDAGRRGAAGAAARDPDGGGGSTRHYQEALPEMVQRCGVSRAAVSRQLQEASAQALRQLCERHFEEVDSG